MDQRRRERIRYAFPLQIQVGPDEHVAIAYDASAGGLGAVCDHAPAIGEEVVVRFKLGASYLEEKEARARVVRVEDNPSGQTWPLRIGLELVEPDGELEDLLKLEAE